MHIPNIKHPCFFWQQHRSNFIIVVSRLQVQRCPLRICLESAMREEIVANGGEWQECVRTKGMQTKRFWKVIFFFFFRLRVWYDAPFAGLHNYKLDSTSGVRSSCKEVYVVHFKGCYKTSIMRLRRIFPYMGTVVLTHTEARSAMACARAEGYSFSWLVA